jgi:hypothetical protein
MKTTFIYAKGKDAVAIFVYTGEEQYRYFEN